MAVHCFEMHYLQHPSPSIITPPRDSDTTMFGIRLTSVNSNVTFKDLDSRLKNTRLEHHYVSWQKQNKTEGNVLCDPKKRFWVQMTSFLTQQYKPCSI